MVFRVEWHSALIPYGLHLERWVADALLESIAEVGDDALWITDFDTIPPHQDTIRLRLSPVELERTWLNPLLPHLNTRLIGESGTWAGEVDWEGVLLLAGDESFMRGFVRRCGGSALLRRRWDAYRNEELLPPSSAARLQDAVATRGWKAARLD
jgi:hypothetical protein